MLIMLCAANYVCAAGDTCAERFCTLRILKFCLGFKTSQKANLSERVRIHMGTQVT